jgi:alkanesulfonate monooxygenase SsuD/methylene tetrahydromethanopterin reductase-like flavin-dependent oxidoreductase (luciferase family)
VTRLLLRFDMRQPDFVATPRADRYAAALDMAAWADTRGFTSVVLSEHHGVADGYLPSPLIMAAAVLGRTRNLVVSVSALLAVLRDPVALAEDIAVLDNIAPGRLAVTVGLGYRDGEYAMFGVDRARRGHILDQNLKIMLDAWTGDPFEYRGAQIIVTPTPASRPHPLLFVGGGSVAAARRAARFDLPFLTDRADPALEDAYRAECARLGVVPSIVMPSGEPCFVHVAEDPERTRAQLARNIFYDASEYAKWQRGDATSILMERLTSVDDLAGSRVYRVLTPEQAVELARATGTLIFHPLVGGLDPELGWASLQLFADRVAPRLAEGS